MASTYLTRTFGNATNRSKCTISFWIKKGFSGDTQQPFCSYADNNNRFQFYFESSDELTIYNKDNGSDTIYLKSKAKYRDPNGWYHCYCSVDTTVSTASDRVKIYVNGERVTEFHSSQNIPNQNSDLSFGNNAFTFYLGRYGGTGHHVNGVLSHFYFIDGSVVAHTEFGSTDSATGEWKLSTNPTISNFGNEGCKLFIDNASLADQSGKGNNMTLAGGTLTKTEDNPSNIFATWNPLWSQSNGNIGDVTFSNGNLTTTTSADYRTTPATLGMKSGKYYWEIKRNEDTGADMHAGVMSENATPANTATWIGNAANGWVVAGDAGQTYTGGTNSSTISNTAFPNAGDIHMCAYDGTTGKIYFGANGTWGGTANPSTGANPHFTLDNSLIYFPCVSTGSDCSANFGNGFFGTTAISSEGTNASGIGKFEYNVPSGFTALSTKGLNE